jgi:hypothetical protein
MEVDAWESILQDNLGHLQGKILAQEMWLLLGIRLGDVDTYAERRLGRAMKKLGWTRKQLRHGGGRPYFYTKGKEKLIRVAVDKGMARVVFGHNDELPYDQTKDEEPVF